MERRPGHGYAGTMEFEDPPCYLWSSIGIDGSLRRRCVWRVAWSVMGCTVCGFVSQLGSSDWTRNFNLNIWVVYHALQILIQTKCS
jgi:hypothetical protein